MNVRQKLLSGSVIPAHPLALTAERKLDERRQRALTRYYMAAGAGGIAVGVHTTQFAIHDPSVGLLKPVLELAYEEASAPCRTRAPYRAATVKERYSDLPAETLTMPSRNLSSI